MHLRSNQLNHMIVTHDAFIDFSGEPASLAELWQVAGVPKIIVKSHWHMTACWPGADIQVTKTQYRTDAMQLGKNVHSRPNPPGVQFTLYTN